MTMIKPVWQRSTVFTNTQKEANPRTNWINRQVFKSFYSLKSLKPKQFTRTRNTCGAAITPDFASAEGCKMPYFLVFYFTVARPGLFVLRMTGDFFPTSDVSVALLVYGCNIEWAMTKRVFVYLVHTVILCLRQFLCITFAGLDTYCVYLPFFTYSCPFSTSWVRLNEVTWQSDYDLA